MNLRYLLAILLLALPLALAAQPRPLPPESVYHHPARMTNQDGRSQALADGRGKPQLVSMFYTSCHYICPLIIDGALAVERQLTPAQRGRLGVTLISIDPDRDTPAALKRVSDQRKLDTQRWRLLRPAKSDLRAVAGLLDVRYRPLDDGEFNHTSVLVLLDAEGRVLASTERIGSRPDPAFVAKVQQALGR